MTEQRGLALVTDLYELTMAQAYLEHDMHTPATFSLFVRKLPPNRGYLVSAGLEDVLRYLLGLHFSGEDIDYLSSTGIFSPHFLDHLAALRFTGDVWAIPEGRLVFANEPVAEVTAPVIEAQIVETYLLNQFSLQTMLAAKAARCVAAARGRTLVDFALRRTQGVDAGLKVARCSYLAGFDATSDVLAGERYGIPVSGTMAHSFVQAYEHETDAFRAFAQSFPERSVFLIDTYDTIEGARKAVQVGREMLARGDDRLQGVRLDSGDMLSLSKGVREILDEAGMEYVHILASGGLDEYEIEELLEAGAPIDAFGVGTKMGVSGDAPWLDTAYKMVAFGERPVLKLSAGKPSLPCAKQVYRFLGEDGRMKRDVISLRDERLDGGEPLLQRVMAGGRIDGGLPSLNQSRALFREEYARLPDECKPLREPAEYPVELSGGLERLYGRLREEAQLTSARELGES